MGLKTALLFLHILFFQVSPAVADWSALDSPMQADFERTLTSAAEPEQASTYFNKSLNSNQKMTLVLLIQKLETDGVLSEISSIDWIGESTEALVCQ